MSASGEGSPVVQLRLLGGFSVTVDGRTVQLDWPTRRAGELVQLLALAPHHRLNRDQVIEALWPHLDADAGGANLRKSAHFARRTLGVDSAVELRQQQVSLFPGAAVTTDVEAFNRAAADATAAGDAEAARAAAVLYTGELLPDARYEEWAQAPREGVDRCYRELLRRSGQWELLHEHDPLDEAACREVMRHELAAGHRHRAISHFGRLRDALKHELGVLPDPETQTVYDTCVRELATDRSPFVGRVEELAVIDGLLASPTPDAHLVVVRGDAGIGKSALCHEIVERAAAAGWTTVAMASLDPGDAYTTLATIIELLLASKTSPADWLDPKSRAVLAELTPAVSPADPLEMGVTRHQMIGATQRVVEAVAGDAGVVIVVDDAELADASSLEVLARLGDRRSGPVIVVLAHRSGSAGDALARCLTIAGRSRPPIVIELEPLEHREIGALARSVGPHLDEQQLSALAARSEGNPFFVLELARAGTPQSDASLGADLRDAIAGRFVALEGDVAAWLRRLALVGGPMDLNSVLALAGCDEADVVRLLDDALASGVLAVRDGAYVFRHDLVRAALAEQLPPHHRIAIHRDAARRLAELGARPARIARHWLEGGRPEEAAGWLLRAADDAIRMGSYAAAVEHADQILAHESNHLEALRRRAQSLDALGDLRALRAYEDLLAVAPRELYHELRPLQALAQIKMGDPEGALVTVADAHPTGLHGKMAKALTLSGAAALGVADPAQGTRLAAEGKRLAIESGDTSAIVVASWAHAAAAHARGELRDTLREDLFDTHDIPSLAVTVFDGQLCITQRLLYGARPYDDVIRWADDFAAEAGRLGAARGVAFATTLRGEAELLAGRLDDAERDLTEGCRLHRRISGATGESLGLQRRAEVALIRGERELARRLLDHALDVARESDIGFHLLDRIYGTRIALAADPEEALAAVVEAEEAVVGPLETCPGCRITLAVPAAIAVARAGDLERIEAYERSCEFLANVVMRLPAWYAALHEVRAHRAIAHGDHATARQRLLAAIEQFTQAGQPFDRARCEQTLRTLPS